MNSATENGNNTSFKISNTSSFAAAVAGDFASATLLRHILASEGIFVTSPKSGVLTLRISRDGKRLELCDEVGLWHDSGHTSALIALCFFLSGGRELAVREDAPGALEHIAAEYSAKILRIGRDDAAEALFIKQGIISDAFCASLFLCNFLSNERTSVRRISHLIPEFTIVSREIPLVRNRREILRELSAYAEGMHKEGRDYLRVCTDAGWISISPAKSRLSLRVTGEGMSEEIANELCDIFIERAHEIDARYKSSEN